MKLRNKKTGEIAETDKPFGICVPTEKTFGCPSYDEIASYDSIAELNEDWEDYKPAEPLIKDEKIRKAVRAWAEANGRDTFKVINEHFNNCRIVGFTENGIPSKSMIEFGTTIAGVKRDCYYTIAELCGEDEK